MKASVSWAVSVLRSQHMLLSQRVNLICYFTKLSLRSRLNIRLPIRQSDRFISFYHRFLKKHNAVALGENRISFFSDFSLSETIRPKLHIRKKPSSDLEVFHQVFIEEEYAPLVRFVLQFQPADAVRNMIDAGANVGYTTVYLKTYFKQAAILCIEPEASNLALLKKNIAANGFLQAEALQAGLWKNEARLKVVDTFRDHKEWSFQLIETTDPGAIQGYSVRSLLNKKQWSHIDILKIDIEGAERYLFETDESAASFLPLVKFIAVEIHDEYGIRETVYEKLAQHHFRVFNTGELTIGVNLSLVPEAKKMYEAQKITT